MLVCQLGGSESMPPQENFHLRDPPDQFWHDLRSDCKNVLSLGSSRITAINSQTTSINACTLAYTSSITTANHPGRWGALGQRSVVRYKSVDTPFAALALMKTEKKPTSVRGPGLAVRAPGH